MSGSQRPQAAVSMWWQLQQPAHIVVQRKPPHPTPQLQGMFVCCACSPAVPSAHQLSDLAKRARVATQIYNYCTVVKKYQLEYSEHLQCSSSGRRAGGAVQSAINSGSQKN